MFGYTMIVNHPLGTITLRAPKKQEVPHLAEGFSSLTVAMNTAGTSARSEEDELEWYEKNRMAADSHVWFIVPDDSKESVGVTSLDKIDTNGFCHSGIVIWKPEWWGKGLATRAHLARTMYAADYLARVRIESEVRTSNPASFKALQRIGYTAWGIEPRSIMRGGKWLDTYHLTWFHPEKTGILYPEGIPNCFKEGIDKARQALALAREIVTFP